MELVPSHSPFDEDDNPVRYPGTPTRAHQHPTTRPQRWVQDETKTRVYELDGIAELTQKGNEIIEENTKNSYGHYHGAKTIGESLDETRARYGTPPAGRGEPPSSRREPAPQDGFRFTETADIAPTSQAFATEAMKRTGGGLLYNHERLIRNVLDVTGRSLEPPEETRQAPAKRSWWQWG